MIPANLSSLSDVSDLEVNRTLSESDIRRATPPSRLLEPVRFEQVGAVDVVLQWKLDHQVDVVPSWKLDHQGPQLGQIDHPVARQVDFTKGQFQTRAQS